MKKPCFLLILLLGFIPNCFSQIENNVRYGIRAGLNYSHLNFSIVSLPLDDPMEMSWKAGGVGGLYMIVPLYERLFIQPEYLFSQAGGEAESSDIEYKLSYLSLPVFLRYEVTNRFSLIAGPQFDLLINAKQENKENSKITSDTESRSVGIAGGVEYGLSSSLGLGIRYFQNVHDIWIPVIGDTRQEFKHQLLQLSMYYIF